LQSDAVAKGLVDALGRLRRALEVARQLAKIAHADTRTLLELPPPPKVLAALAAALTAPPKDGRRGTY